MTRGVLVTDAATAESTAKRYLESQKNVVEAKVIRIWPPKGAKGVWEVDGIVTIRRRLLMKERRLFRLQIDPENGDVTNFEAVRNCFHECPEMSLSCARIFPS
jgi:hypothetical protein